jgi:hypothetical protein
MAPRRLPTVETAVNHPHGVAKVETQLSFLNQLVSWPTIYIYAPMTIEVTCASDKTADSTGPQAARSVSRSDGQGVTSMFTAAATRATETHHAVTVKVQ